MTLTELCKALVEGEECLQACESVGLEYFIGLCGEPETERLVNAALRFAREHLAAQDNPTGRDSLTS